MADFMREHSAGGSQKDTAAQLSRSAPPMPTVHAVKDLGSSEDDPNRLSAADRRPTYIRGNTPGRDLGDAIGEATAGPFQHRGIAAHLANRRGLNARPTKRVYVPADSLVLADPPEVHEPVVHTELMGACRSGRRASAAGLEVSRLQPLRTEAAHLQFDPRSAGFSALSSGGDAPNSVRVLRARAQSLALPGRRPWVQVTIDAFALRNVSAINIRRRLDLKPAAGRRWPPLAPCTCSFRLFLAWAFNGAILASSAVAITGTLLLLRERAERTHAAGNAYPDYWSTVRGAFGYAAALWLLVQDGLKVAIATCISPTMVPFFRKHRGASWARRAVRILITILRSVL